MRITDSRSHEHTIQLLLRYSCLRKANQALQEESEGTGFEEAYKLKTNHCWNLNFLNRCLNDIRTNT